MRARAGELIARDDFESLQWLLDMIRELRPDVASGTSLFDPDFFRWLIYSGIGEYAALRESGALRNFLNTEANDTGLTVLQTIIYRSRPDIQQAFPLPEKQQEFLDWFSNHGVEEHSLAGLLPVAPETDRAGEATDPMHRPFGVNLIGYAYGQMGIGEELRMLARSFLQANIPFTIINFPPGKEPVQNDRSMAAYVGEEAPYRYNIFCFTAPEQGRFFLERGSEIFRGRYNIGNWSWELNDWPREWLKFSRLADEIWLASEHVYRSLAPVCTVPVLVMPVPIETGGISGLGRRDFNLPESAYIFAFSFDFNSTMRRKNPEACLKAFQQAFPQSKKNVALVIKAHKPKQPGPAWEELKQAAARDRRITIIEETLDRGDLLALYSNCDCFVSLHRAEGFGMGIAEALLLGLDVIATGYSGNLDFCRGNPAAKLVDYTLVPLEKGDYPHGDGMQWAEPDINHAAALMRKCAGRKHPRRESANVDFSLARMGERYMQRLEFLSGPDSA